MIDSSTSGRPPAPQPAAQPSFPEAIVGNLTEMGFPRDQVIAALRVAGGNPDRAIDVLMGVRDDIS